MPERLTGLGLSADETATLLAGVTAAEAALGTEAIALIDCFDRELCI
jgi:hypothetical protein